MSKRLLTHCSQLNVYSLRFASCARKTIATSTLRAIDNSSSRRSLPRYVAPNVARRSFTFQTANGDNDREPKKAIEQDEDETILVETTILENEPHDTNANATISGDEVAQFLRDNTKLTNIRVLDLTDKISWTNSFVIATGQSSRQLAAAARTVQREFKNRILRLSGKSGNIEEAPDWVLLDCGSTVLQLFTKEGEETYDLETLWQSRPTEDELLLHGSEEPEIDGDVTVAAAKDDEMFDELLAEVEQLKAKKGKRLK